MEKIHIVTDSTAELNPAFVQKEGIMVAPLSVNFGNDSYKDGVEITADQFYEKLQTSKDLPTTSQVSVGAFLEIYQQLQKEGGTVFSVHISQKLSGTYQAAVMAKEEIEDLKIIPIDSRTTSISLRFLVEMISKLRQEGHNAEEIKQKVEEAIAKQKIYFSVGTLEYLEKGGRIGKAQALLGSILNIKPLLTLDKEGGVVPFEKLRGKKKVYQRLESLLLSFVEENDKDCYKGLIYGTNKEEAENIKNQITAKHGFTDISIGQLGPIVGTHVGPDILGLALTIR